MKDCSSVSGVRLETGEEKGLSIASAVLLSYTGITEEERLDILITVKTIAKIIVLYRRLF
jgi:hypothetical protein